jgi:hypothetical protein
MRCTESGIDWLLADHQLGLVLPSDMVKSLHREVLLRRRTPSLIFRDECIEVGALRIPLERKREQKALDAVAEILASPEAVHLYLTSHLLYGGGNRIITFSNRKPLLIIYKVIGTMRVSME